MRITHVQSTAYTDDKFPDTNEIKGVEKECEAREMHFGAGLQEKQLQHTSLLLTRCRGLQQGSVSCLRD